MENQQELIVIKNNKRKKGQLGQVAVEYVLLLAFSVTMSALITRTVVSRNPESPGFLITKWRNILVSIGEDFADDVAP